MNNPKPLTTPTHPSQHTQYSPQEFGGYRAHLQDPSSQRLALIEREGVYQFVPLDQAAGDTGGHAGLSGRDDDADARVATPPHGSPTGIHHKADEETVGDKNHGD